MIEDRDTVVHQLESGLGAARKEFDRRVELQRQESELLASQLQQQISDLMSQQQQQKQQHAALQPQKIEIDLATRDDEWKKMIVSSQKKDEYITDLEKHLVFYKSKAKQMQAQLQQLIRDSAKCNQQNDDDGDEDERERGEGGHDDSHQLKRRIQQLEEANDTLMKDLATAKVGLVYLRVSQSEPSTDVSNLFSRSISGRQRQERQLKVRKWCASPRASFASCPADLLRRILVHRPHMSQTTGEFG